jgi:hypothetical protein
MEAKNFKIMKPNRVRDFFQRLKGENCEMDDMKTSTEITMRFYFRYLHNPLLDIGNNGTCITLAIGNNGNRFHIRE